MDVEEIIIQYYRDTEKDYELTFKERYKVWIERQKNCGRSDNTINKYKVDYVRFFEDDPFESMKITNITDEDISTYFIILLQRKQVTYRAFKLLFGYINGVFEKLMKDKIIKENPCIYIDLPKYKKYCAEPKDQNAEQRTVSDDERVLLLKQLQRDYVEKPELITPYAVELAIYTGMRVGELSALRRDNINFDKGEFKVCMSEEYNRETKEYYIDKTKNIPCPSKAVFL